MCAGLGGEADHVQQFRAAFIDRVRAKCRAAAGVHRVEQRNAEVLGQGQRVERSRQLEAACNAEPRALMRGQTVERAAGKANAARLVAQRAAHAVHQRALARAVGADEPDAFAVLDGELDRLQRDETAETLAEIGDL